VSRFAGVISRTFRTLPTLFPDNPPCHEVHPLIGEIIPRKLDADPIEDEDLPCIDVEKVQSKVGESASSHPSTGRIALRDRQASFGRGSPASGAHL
jgi:hypothetical protein